MEQNRLKENSFINNSNSKNKNNPKKMNHQYLVISNAMRSYLESLPEKLTVTEELSQYQFWKSLRTEFIATFLFIIFTTSTSVISSLNNRNNILNSKENASEDFSKTANNKINDNASVVYLINQSEGSQLKQALAVGLTVATLVQCTGHVCGCHLSMAITLGLYVSSRVTPLRLISYLFVQCLASICGCLVVVNLFGIIMPPIMPTITSSTSSHLIADGIAQLHLTPTQVFGFEFLATLLIVLTYLANCDQNRCDLGFKSLSIGLSYTVGHLFAYSATGASFNPARTLAISVVTGQYCLHWIYWIAPLIAGLFGGLLYEYIGSIKVPQTNHSNDSGSSSSSSASSSRQPTATELKHQFNDKKRQSKGFNYQSNQQQQHKLNNLNEFSISIVTSEPNKLIRKPEIEHIAFPVNLGEDYDDDYETEFSITR